MRRIRFFVLVVEIFRIAIFATNTCSCCTTGGVLISTTRSSEYVPKRDHLTALRMTSKFGTGGGNGGDDVCVVDGGDGGDGGDGSGGVVVGGGNVDVAVVAVESVLSLSVISSLLSCSSFLSFLYSPVVASPFSPSSPLSPPPSSPSSLFTCHVTLIIDSNVPVSCCATNRAAFMLFLRWCRFRVAEEKVEPVDVEVMVEVKGVVVGVIGSIRIKKCCLS